MASCQAPRRLHDYLQRRKPSAAQVAQLCTCELELEPFDFIAPTDFDSITLRQILVQSGLWSIKPRDKEQDYLATSSLSGGITNFDVARHYIPILTGYLLNIDAATAHCSMFLAQQALLNGDIALTCLHLNELFYRLPKDALEPDADCSYRTLLSAWLSCEKITVFENLSGLDIIAYGKVFMVTLKLIAKPSALQLTQLDQLKQSRKPTASPYSNITNVQLIISAQDHQIVAWTQENPYYHQQGRLTLFKPRRK